MPDDTPNRRTTLRRPSLVGAGIERAIRAVSGMPGVITDGEYDTEMVSAAALDMSVAAVTGLGGALIGALSKRYGPEPGATPVRMTAAEATPLWILDAGLAALATIDAMNGVGAPDEGADFLVAARLLEGAGNGLAAALPDADRWNGVARDGYAERSTAAASDLEEIRELDNQMQTLLARQADSVQKAHLTVAGGMNALIPCYPVALWLRWRCGLPASVTFQIGMVSSVLVGTLAMEYLVMQESVDVSLEVEKVAAGYHQAPTPTRVLQEGAALDPADPQSLGAGNSGSGRARPSPPPAMPSVAELANRAGGGRMEKLALMLTALAKIPTRHQNSVQGDHHSPDDAAPPTASLTPAVRSAQQGSSSAGRNRRIDDATPTGSDATGEPDDEAASQTAEGAGAPNQTAQPAGIAPIRRPAGGAQPAGPMTQRDTS